MLQLLSATAFRTKRCLSNFGVRVEQVGGVEYMVRLEQEDPKTFLPLLIKTLPPEPRVPQENGLNIRIDLT